MVVGPVPSQALVFMDPPVQYLCPAGFTADGQVGGSETLNVTCGAAGVLLGAGDVCMDVNECAVNNGGCEQICTNTIGSRTCSCGTGYSQSSATGCSDIDECGGGTNSCLQQCENVNGSFTCACMSGFTLDAQDRVSCIQTSCGIPPTSFSGTESVFAGAELLSGEILVYACMPGYTSTGLAGGDMNVILRCYDNGTLAEVRCLDVDECVIGNGNCVSECHNLVGGVVCGCPRGQVLSKNGSVCIEILDLLEQGTPNNGAVFIEGEVYMHGDGTNMYVPSVFQVGPAFAMVFSFRQALNTGGYLLAKTTRDGTQRDFALYLSRLHPRVTFYYRSPGGGSHSSLPFTLTASLSDGRLHRLMLVVSGTLVTLVVDDVIIDAKVLLGEVEMECIGGGVDCVTFVGMRSSPEGGAFEFTGVIRQAVILLNIDPSFPITPIPAFAGEMKAPDPTGMCVWCVVCGVWCVVCGVWCVVCVCVCV